MSSLFIIPREKEEPIREGDLHICFYVDQFQKSFEILESKGELYREHSYSDQTENWDQVKKAAQYRTIEIMDVKGEKIHKFEHEIRSKDNFHFCRPLRLLANQK